MSYNFLASLRLQSIALLLVLASYNGYAQNVITSKFGKGIRILAKDSSFYMKASARIQNRFDGTRVLSDDPTYTDKFYVRRARVKFSGWAFSPKVGYKVELDVNSGQVLDAVIKWEFAPNFQFWFGQTKLPGNIERLISSQKLQFVDRSALNSKYTIDRDKGIQLRHTFKVGKMLFREAASISIGEGKNYKGASKGHDYTGKVEWLPFGKFKSKGDYFGSDLKREPTPKLAIGLTYDYNAKAIKSRGQLGSILAENKDLAAIFADMMFKYKGLSVMAEYVNKKVTTGSPVIVDALGDFKESFYTGSAMNIQLGYLFANNIEIATRYTAVHPEKRTLNNELEQFTLGLSKYVVGHNLKVQSDFSLLKEEHKADRFQVRVQVELSF